MSIATVTRKIGDTVVPAIGFGAMGLSAYYGKPQPDEERFKVLDAVYARGVRHWDTANSYMDSEDLIGRWFKRTGKRDEIFLATKFGITDNGVNGSPDQEKAAYVRLFYPPPVNPAVELQAATLQEKVHDATTKAPTLTIAAELGRRTRLDLPPLPYVKHARELPTPPRKPFRLHKVEGKKDPSEFAISPRRNSMELLSMMCMYSQTLTQAKRSHSQHIKRLAAALKSAYHLGIVHHLSAPTVLNAPNLHISDLKHSFARYVLSATQTYKQCETRTVVPPKPISAKINAEERENGAWPVVSTATQSGVEQVLDMTLPTTRSKVSVNEIYTTKEGGPR
ncbi:hypothetical protein FIBSPDRAFT_897903 [Athelia psychrophila]|uniref:NADP-dependent oxidoreductase domain-containing protein n=1 Tax=Athelia psychrophila TaxID=1759441 RepID=A0A166BLX9_9AGAM|nr:hypothetical protein FIBSPDRAFT_897903 [Fibularhizoctonia sp. CBS 109695]